MVSASLILSAVGLSPCIYVAMLVYFFGPMESRTGLQPCHGPAHPVCTYLLKARYTVLVTDLRSAKIPGVQASPSNPLSLSYQALGWKSLWEQVKPVRAVCLGYHLSHSLVIWGKLTPKKAQAHIQLLKPLLAAPLREVTNLIV